MLYPYPHPHPHSGILQEHTRIPGIVPWVYRIHKLSGTGEYEDRTEFTEMMGTGNTPGIVLYVPYGTQPFHSPCTEVSPGYDGMEVLQLSLIHI